MLIMTTRIGDRIVIRTPGGDVRLLIGGTEKRRRILGIDAPREYPIVLETDGPKPKGPPPGERATLP